MVKWVVIGVVGFLVVCGVIGANDEPVNTPKPKPSASVTTKSPAPSKSPIAKPSPKTTPTRPRPTTPSASPSATYYANCAAVREAGKAPLSSNDPGYSTRLDRDGDGIACDTEG